MTSALLLTAAIWSFISVNKHGQLVTTFLRKKKYKPESSFMAVSIGFSSSNLKNMQLNSV
jgi:hypothetical protein